MASSSHYCFDSDERGPTHVTVYCDSKYEDVRGITGGVDGVFDRQRYGGDRADVIYGEGLGDAGAACSAREVLVTEGK